MRVNIYAEELTHRIEIITKPVDGKTFYGIRSYLGFPFIHREGDDDSSAVTFWVPWDALAGNKFGKLMAIFDELVQQVKRARTMDVLANPAQAAGQAEPSPQSSTDKASDPANRL